MRLTPRINLPPIPRTNDRAVQQYLQELDRAMRQAFQAVYEDIAKGQSELTTYAAAPTATQVARNQLVLRTDAGNEKIYANVAGTMKSVALT